MVLEGEIPVLDEEYDLSDPSGTAMTAVSGIVGVAMMFGIFAAGRAVYNRLSQETDAVNQIEVL
jgi:hypothetical protein